ncbi:PH domain-containing protein [Leeuwenhoekiella marinoflava]|uniref:YdbS-like PH domain-containing protein n=2 Tax=Leeuwenhoekiella marinoflava TaxID=988 RepID=A0A4Q0PQJ0_9FLAO|nr:PH domain-containing protein [Leeuwenhoekiella marinoflava]RXG32784.1 hypothetical protein DSL99_563 [Leeuwenhoekiella marinoflava]SHE56710.1 hypothetical protein SAMN02745246_00621 [Leeuwenhoekiella marinoflava DSM 3653]
MEYTFTNAPVDLETLPDYQQLNYTSVSKKRLYKVWTVLAVLFILIAVGLYFLREATDVPMLIPGLTIGVFVVFTLFFFYQFLLQKKIGYALRERDIAYKRGFLFEKITIIPFNRIQHISTSAGALDKVFKISNLNIFTAGGAGSDINIPGLPPELAARLKEKVANHLTETDE